MKMPKNRARYPQKKKDAMVKMEKFISDYPFISIVDLHKVRANQISQLRKRFRDNLKFYAIKNTLAIKTISKDERLAGLVQGIRGQALFIFSKMDPFELNILFDKNKALMAAKGGDTATNDVMIPAGNTGLPAGPILSEFKEAKVPTKIESGSIWVSSDTIVVTTGEKISPKLASLLSKLNIKAIRSGVSIRTAYYKGLTLGEKDIRVDIEEMKAKFATLGRQGFNLAYSARYPAKDVLPLLIAELANNGRALAKAIEYPTASTIGGLISDHVARADSLLAVVKEKGYTS